MHKFLVGYDFTPEIFTNTRLVLGVYGGLAQMDYESRVVTNMSYVITSGTARDFIYGAKAGFLYEIGSGEIELGARAERVSYGVEGGGDIDQTNVGLYLGYNYKF